MDKQYRTRDGRAVEVLKVGMNHNHFPVVAVVTDSNGSQSSSTLTPTGSVYADIENIGDLIEVKPRIKQGAWVNVYSKETFAAYSTKEEADKYAGSKRIACVKIEIDCEHGEGL